MNSTYKYIIIKQIQIELEPRQRLENRNAPEFHYLEVRIKKWEPVCTKSQLQVVVRLYTATDTRGGNIE